MPTDQEIKSLKRGVQLKVNFGWRIKSKREKIGNRWKVEYPGFQILIHTINPEINIIRLISTEEIKLNQDFFEKCGRDYRNLATTLISEFAKNYNLEIDPTLPMNTLYHTNKFGYEPIGEFNGWRYAFHGIHCAFTNLTSGQHIEVPLNYGLEFGQLNPYFFVRFIESSEKYRPLPVQLFCDYADGKRILEEMLELGKFEYVNSNWPNEKGIVISDREKVEVPVRSSNQS